tara:strand:+ start:605 stop:1192 length:588 start_codon:yes stop_codon:yes gene_type:complete
MDNNTSFLRLLKIMDELRAQCPWDKKQTMDSLSYLTIEETYELIDAIIEKDMEGVKGELGDLMLHLVFYAKIASETNDFDINDVINTVCDKLIERHPHIYGDVKVDSEEQVKANWEKIKLKKGKKSVLSGVPKSLPAMVKATRIQERLGVLVLIGIIETKSLRRSRKNFQNYIMRLVNLITLLKLKRNLETYYSQ